MKKIYPILSPLEISDYNSSDDIFDSVLPGWLKEKMEEVAKIENCEISDLQYKRELKFDKERNEWADFAIIFSEKNDDIH